MEGHVVVVVVVGTGAAADGDSAQLEEGCTLPAEAGS